MGRTTESELREHFRRMLPENGSSHSFAVDKEMDHGLYVSKLAYAIAGELRLSEEKCEEIAIAGMLHDIGKRKLNDYINGEERDPLIIEELKYVRMHSKLGYEELKDQNYSSFILESILYHHENYDGTGYPSNLSGTEIPLGARILRVCDAYAELTSRRSYRDALEDRTALEVMIHDVKKFDMRVFLAFQRIIHKEAAVR